MNLSGLANALKTTVQKAKTSGVKAETKQSMATAAPKSDSDLMKQMDADSLDSQTLAAMDADSSDAKPMPRPRIEVEQENKALMEKLNKEARQNGSFNVDAERQYNVTPLDDFFKDSTTLAGRGLNTVGNVLAGGVNNVKDITELKVPRIAMEGAGAIGAGAQVVGDTIQHPINIVKAPFEAAGGALQQVPEIAGNIGSAAWNASKMVPGSPAAILAPAEQIAIEAQKRTTGNADSITDVFKKSGKGLKQMAKDVIKKTGLNPDSAAAKVGEIAAEAYAGSKLTGGLQSLLGAEELGVAKKFGDAKNLGTQLIPRSTNPFVKAAQKTLDFATDTLPKTADDIADAGINSVGYSAASKGEAPSFGDIVSTVGANKLMDFFAKGRQIKAVQKFNENVPGFAKTAGKNQSKESVQKEIQDAIQTGYVGKNASKIDDLASAKITAYNTRASKLIDEADKTFKGVEKSDLVQGPLNKLKEQFLAVGDVDKVNKLDDLASEFMGEGIDKVNFQMKNAALNLKTQKSALSNAKQAVKEAKTPIERAQAEQLMSEAQNRFTNVQRRISELEKNKPLYEKMAEKPTTLKLKDLEKIKQDNRILNQASVSGNKQLSQEDDLRKQLMDLITQEAVGHIEKADPRLLDLFKQQNIGYKIKEAVKKEARAGASLGKGGKAALVNQAAADTLNSKGVRSLVKTLINR